MMFRKTDWTMDILCKDSASSLEGDDGWTEEQTFGNWREWIPARLSESARAELERDIPFVQGEEEDSFRREESERKNLLGFLTSRYHLFPEMEGMAVHVLRMEHHRVTRESFCETVEQIQRNRDLSGEPKPLLHPEFYQWIVQNASVIETLYRESLAGCVRSFPYTYFGWQTMYKTYLIRTHQGVMERIEHLFFRVALFLFRDDFAMVRRAFQLLLGGEAIHATPTLYHAGLLHSQMASCFLVGTDDSVSGIFKTVSDVAMISKYAGGIGIHISNIRGEHSYIHGTNGKSNGIMPMLRVFNATSRYIDQCFEGHVPVLTLRGWIPIEHVRPGIDRVLTHSGSFHPIRKRLVYLSSPDERIEAVVPELSLSVRTREEDRQTSLWRDLVGSSYRCTPSHDLLFLRQDHETQQLEMLFESCSEATRDMRSVWMDISSPFSRASFSPILLLPLSTDNDSDVSFSSLFSSFWMLGFLYRRLEKTKEDNDGKTEIFYVDVPIALESKWRTCVRRWGKEEAWYSLTNNDIRQGEGEEEMTTRWIVGRGDEDWFSFEESCWSGSTVAWGEEVQKKRRTRGWVSRELPMHLLFSDASILPLVYDGYCFGKGGKETMIQREKEHIIVERMIRTMQYRLWIMKEKEKEKDEEKELSAFHLSAWICPSPVEYRRIRDLQTTPLYDLEIDQCPSYQTIMGMAHNGGGKRKGAFAMYMEPWHCDIIPFLMARRPVGHEEERARDLFYGLWVPDRFMEMVEQDGPWYLMGTEEAQTLTRVWGTEFNRLYDHYIEEGRFVRKMQARELWTEVLRSQLETGTPYLLYKDTCNRLSNQKNLGTIRSSNLCCEIIEYSDEKEYAVCNLASISLKACLRYEHGRLRRFREECNSSEPLRIYGRSSCVYCQLLCSQLEKFRVAFTYLPLEDQDRSRFVREYGPTMPYVFQREEYLGGFTDIWERYLQPEFDFDRLRTVVRQLVDNLNLIIDKNDYPLEECRRSNIRHRPIGLGVQGLSNVFMERLEAYDSDSARQLNRSIFEHLYFCALERSMELSKIHGSYTSFQGSPLSQGQFHFDLWGLSYDRLTLPRDRWETLRAQIQSFGVRNSLLVAPMPTASTSQILGNTESFEPLTSNFYLRRTNAGEFYVINKTMQDMLLRLGHWTPSMIQRLLLSKGSVEQFPELPLSIRKVFRTVWEISPKHLIEMASDRQAFIDQSQSFNVYLPQSDLGLLNKIHFYGWKKQLKTGCYYLRTRAPLTSQHFAIDPEKEASLLRIHQQETRLAAPAQREEEEEEILCEGCSS